MATTYTHSISHSAESSDGKTITAVHSRHLSTISDATLNTSTTMHSQPNAPTIRPTTPQSADYGDDISYHERNPDSILALPQWSSLQASKHPSKHSMRNEKQSIASSKASIVPLKYLIWIRSTLELFMAAWSIYSLARYLWAFTIYNSFTGQMVSIGLGLSAGVAFALSACALILSLLQTTLLLNGISVQAILTLRHILRLLASTFLVIPSILNILFLFVWKTSANVELRSDYRCNLDIDLVWSTTESPCLHKRQSLTAWIIASTFRLVVTSAIVIMFHVLVSSSRPVPKRRLSKKSQPIRERKSHTRMDSQRIPLVSHPPQGTNFIRETIILPQTSDSTFSTKASPRNRLRSARSQTATISDDGGGSGSMSQNNPDVYPSTSDSPDSEREFGGFIDRFRSLINQITRETEEGLAFARSDDTSSQHTFESLPQRNADELNAENIQHDYERANMDDDDDDFYSGAPPLQIIDVDGFRQEYFADEHVRMMNGYIRRMPTIESMGSKELRSSLGASSMHTNKVNSRPPTRNTLASWASTEFSTGEPRSRSNSLSAQAEYLAGMRHSNQISEIGELMERGPTIRCVESSKSTGDLAGAVDSEGYSTSTTNSRETVQSFHTASTGTTANSLTKALAEAAQTSFPLPPTRTYSEEMAKAEGKST